MVQGSFAARSKTTSVVLVWLLVGSTLALGDITPVGFPARPPVDTATAASTCFSGTPDRTYDVAAIDIPIVLNNFGIHDPFGRMYVLQSEEAAVRAAVAASPRTPVEAVQPLVLRAHVGDCVAINFVNHILDISPLPGLVAEGLVATSVSGTINFTNGFLGTHLPENPIAPYSALVPDLPVSTERASIHVHKALTAVMSQGAMVGRNPDSTVAVGESISYRWYIPDDPQWEGAYYFHSHADARYQAAHGLFGALIAEPKGYEWLDPVTADPSDTGWEAMLTYAASAPDKAENPDFREIVTIFHDEVPPCETESLLRSCHPLPTNDEAGLSSAYGPGTKAVNYRSEPFRNRFEKLVAEEEAGNLSTIGSSEFDFLNAKFDHSQAYGSYGNGDPATPIARAYVGDPTKWRLVHGGPGQHHVFHLHGGGDRWRFQPNTEDTQFDDGTIKTGNVAQAQSERLDVQNVGPGESFDLEIEGGAGGVQGGVGDFLYHCHIVEHYVAGMWGFWRVYDTLQDGTNPHFPGQKALKPLPDRAAPPSAVNTVDLVGTHIFAGTSAERVIVAGATNTGVSPPEVNVDEWVQAFLPAKGVPRVDDASVWDWTTVTSSGLPLYLGEPEVDRSWENYVPQSSGLWSTGPGPGRPELQFNPDNGRPAFPMLHPHLGKRPPFAPDHGPTPYLGKELDAGNPLGLCVGDPQRTSRHYNVVALSVPVTYNAADTDPAGAIFVHAEDKATVLANPSLAENLVLRANVNDCVDITFSSNLTDGPENAMHSKVNMHIHLVQFDVQASDGVITGANFEQSVRPMSTVPDVTNLAAAASAGATTIVVDNPNLFTNTFGSPKIGASVAIGMGTAGVEVAKVQNVVVATKTITLDRALQGAHAAGAYVGFPGGIEVAKLASAATAGDTSIVVSNPTVFVDATGAAKVGSLVGIDLATPDHEEAKVVAVDLATKTVTLDRALAKSHGAGARAGYEFVHYRWYPDVELGMVYWHDHVDGIRSWTHGLFGGLVVEPAGSTWHNPTTGTPIRDGTAATAAGPYADPHTVDIRVADEPDYREFVAALQDRNFESPGGQGARTDPRASINLRNAPFDLRDDRNADPRYYFSSTVHGDPSSDLVRAYAGDRVVVRLLYAGQSHTRGVDTFAVSGHRFALERHQPTPLTLGSLSLGISSQFNLELECGAGSGFQAVPGDPSTCTGQHAGDFLYHLSSNEALTSGGWGIFRVYDKLNSSLLPLSDRAAPPGPANSGFPNNVAALNDDLWGLGPVPDDELDALLPTVNVGAPFVGTVATVSWNLLGPTPAPPASSGSVGPAGAPVRHYDIAAVSLPIDVDGAGLVKADAALFVPLADVPALASGLLKPQPLVLRANAGEVVEVSLTNLLALSPARLRDSNVIDNFLFALDPLPEDELSAAGFSHVSLAPTLLSVDPLGSGGISVGYDPDFGVAPGKTLTYRWYADKALGAVALQDFSHVVTEERMPPEALLPPHPIQPQLTPTAHGVIDMTNGQAHAKRGLYGMLIIEPAGSTYSDPVTGAPLAAGSSAVIRPASGPAFREFAVQFAADDDVFESSVMPYDNSVEGLTTVNYRATPYNARVGVIGTHECHLNLDECRGFGIREMRNPLNFLAHASLFGDPATPLFEAFAGEPVVFRALTGAGSQLHVFSVAGHHWNLVHDQPTSNLVDAVTIGPGDVANAWMVAGGGYKTAADAKGDYLWGDHRLPMMEAGAWGLLRVHDPADPLDPTLIKPL